MITSIIRRRRYFVLKLFLLCSFVATLFLWTRVSHNPNRMKEEHLQVINAENYQKADLFAGMMDSDFQQNSIEGGGTKPKKPIQKPKHHNDVNTNKLLEKREKAIKENTDEFLEVVLKDYGYEEVDLQSKHDAKHDEYDDEIAEDSLKIQMGLGERGIKAEVPKFQKDIAEEIQKKEAFNRFLSEMISPNRTAPDTREKACRTLEYDENLPTMSIVIIYTNEAFTSLTRTIHSTINMTPAKYLEEIILVDDFSDRRDLRGKLERYIATKFPFGKVRLVRLDKRSGLIRARMIGARLAVGDVLLFLDAHCECVKGWAEPLLQRIKEDRKAVVCPIIDVIDDKTLEYYHGNGEFFQIGGFTWSGHFTWINIPKYESDRKEHHHSPTRSPTMAGGLFGIERKYFWEIGSYDSDMQLWGGENLEMSFRIWQCGGSVEIIPCSRVGHIFRNFHPYSFPNNVDSHGLNTARLAEVWMDDYKELFYSHRKDLKTAKYGDVTKRKEMREKLNCKSFKWYLDNIYREKFQMKFASKKIGQVRNVDTNHCLDNMQHGESEEYTLSVYPCHPEVFSSQTFLISNDNHLRRENECATSWKDNQIQMVSCDILSPEEQWTITEDSEIKNERTGKCLTVVSNDSGKELKLLTCGGESNQKWSFKEKPAGFEE